MVTKEDCIYRRGIEITPRLRISMKKVVDDFNATISTPQCCIPYATFTARVCTHEKAPYIIFAGLKDNYLCDFCVKEGLCPLGITNET